MIAVIETDAPGEGNRHVAGAHLAMVALYLLAAILPLRALARQLRETGFDESAEGMVWTGAVLFGLAAIHGTVARGAYVRRSWSRTVLRILAGLLFVAFPVGTAFAFYVFRNTRYGRW